ncbi:MAG: hypothetical protein EZS28_037969, partial [Streblomastix strix]
MDQFFAEPGSHINEYGVGVCRVLKQKCELGSQFANHPDEVFQ